MRVYSTQVKTIVIMYSLIVKIRVYDFDFDMIIVITIRYFHI